MALIMNLPVSFISLIGLLMVFGCSLDYGVFVMDFLLYRGEDKPGVWSALSLCAFATIAGFAPLVFAKHPVLNDLGQALLWGTLGTYIGSLWGIPSVYQMFKRKAART
jgi:predicted exporter